MAAGRAQAETKVILRSCCLGSFRGLSWRSASHTRVPENGLHDHLVLSWVKD
jgi:hypothetical protein